MSAGSAITIFTDSMGFAGDFARPEFNAAVETLVAACNKHGKAAGFLAGDVETAICMAREGLSLSCLRHRRCVVPRRPLAGTKRASFQ